MAVKRRCSSLAGLPVDRLTVGRLALPREPNHRRHPPRLPVAAIRKESRGIAMTAVIAAMHVEDSGVGEFATGERMQIRLPAASRVGDER